MMSDTHPYTMRLQRFLARAGVASRRGSERLIREGRVCVNGKVVQELGTKVNTLSDEVSVDGIVAQFADESIFIVLNKPMGYLTTMSDPYGRPTVAELIPCHNYPGIFPVGRLDSDTTGTLLFTTDGIAGNTLLHPSHHVWKEYLALCKGRIKPSDIGIFEQGIMLDDGMCAPAKAEILPVNSLSEFAVFQDENLDNRSLIRISLHEGRKHQVKRMMDAIGYPVIRLHRISFGDVRADDLLPGEWRFAHNDERSFIQTLVEGALERGE